MKKLDKKQIPQFAALCVLTAGVSGYLVIHLVAPSQVSAGTRPAATPTPAVPAAGPASSPGVIAKASDPKSADPKSADAKPGDAKPGDPGDTMNAPPPSPAMHDPFAVGYVDPDLPPAGGPAASAHPAALALPKLPAAAPKQSASIRGLGAMPVSFPSAPALPASLSSFPAQPGGTAPGLAPSPVVPALPEAPAAPRWMVTGVLQGATGKVAILRSGEARRIVHSGDFVDSTYRVTGVTRSAVMLRHGTTFYQLTLGGLKALPARPGAVPEKPSRSEAVPLSVPKQAAVIDSAIIPVYHTARPKAVLVHLKQQGPGLSLTSESLSLPKPASSTSTGAAQKLSFRQNVAPLKIAKAISFGLRLLDVTISGQDHKAR